VNAARHRAWAQIEARHGSIPAGRDVAAGWERWWTGIDGTPGEIVWDADAADLADDLDHFAASVADDLTYWAASQGSFQGSFTLSAEGLTELGRGRRYWTGTAAADAACS